MVKKSAMCSFFLVLIGIGFTIASMCTYWYYVRIGDDDSTHTIVYSKYDKIKVSLKDGDGDTTSSKTMKYEGDSDERKIYEASLAFTALSFCILVVAAFLILLSAIGLLKKIPCIGGILNFLGKFILVGGTVTCFLAVFIFLGLPKARKNDCEDGLEVIGGVTGCDNDYFDKFNKNEDDFAFSPYLGWIFMVISSAACIAATIINIIGGIF